MALVLNEIGSDTKEPVLPEKEVHVLCPADLSLGIDIPVYRSDWLSRKDSSSSRWPILSSTSLSLSPSVSLSESVRLVFLSTSLHKPSILDSSSVPVSESNCLSLFIVPVSSWTECLLAPVTKLLSSRLGSCTLLSFFVLAVLGSGDSDCLIVKVCKVPNEPNVGSDV